MTVIGVGGKSMDEALAACDALENAPRKLAGIA